MVARAAVLLSLCAGASALDVGSQDYVCAHGNGVRVPFMTYNVLAPEFTPDRDGSRWVKVRAYLESAVKMKAVIALQELDDTWNPKVSDFLVANQYSTAAARRDRILAVLLAWPHSEYEKTENHTVSSAEMLKFFERGNPWRLDPDGAEGARHVRRFGNTVLMAHLKPHRYGGAPFWVATCHMPALFTEGSLAIPIVHKSRAQAIHMYLALGLLRDKAQGDPAVFMGDFNFRPASTQYLLVEGGLTTHPDNAFLSPLTQVWPDGEPMQSAYKQCFRAEPTFTAYTYSPDRRQGVPGTIDYIWMSGRIAARECLRLPASAGTPLPNDQEGSDHLPLLAVLEVGVPREEKQDSDIARQLKFAAWSAQVQPFNGMGSDKNVNSDESTAMSEEKLERLYDLLLQSDPAQVWLDEWTGTAMDEENLEAPNDSPPNEDSKKVDKHSKKIKKKERKATKKGSGRPATKKKLLEKLKKKNMAAYVHNQADV